VAVWPGGAVVSAWGKWLHCGATLYPAYLRRSVGHGRRAVIIVENWEMQNNFPDKD